MRSVDVVVGSKNRVTTIVESIERLNTEPRRLCPASGAEIVPLPFDDDGLYRQIDMACGACGLVLHLSSGRKKIPHHLDRKFGAVAVTQKGKTQ